MPKSFLPMWDRVVIQPISLKDKNTSCIILLDSSKEKPVEGIVLAVGPGRVALDTGVFIPMVLKPGDHVIFNDFMPNKVTIDKEDFYFIKEQDVLSKVIDE